MSQQTPTLGYKTRQAAAVWATLLVALMLFSGCGSDPAPTATAGTAVTPTLPAVAPPAATASAATAPQPTTAATEASATATRDTGPGQAALTPGSGRSPASTEVAPMPAPTTAPASATPSKAPGGLLKHHDLPPGGIERQITYGSLPATGGGGPLLSPGDRDTQLAAAEVGQLFQIPLVGWKANAAIQAELKAPGGQITHQTATTDDQGSATVDWVSLPGAPLGQYSVTVHQGLRSATGSFLAQRATMFHAAALPQQGPAGTTFRVALAGLAPHAAAPIYVYRQSADHSSTYLTMLPALSADDKGEALLTLPTAPGDPAGHYLVVTAPDLPGAEFAVTVPPGKAAARTTPGPLARQDTPPAGVDARVLFELGNNADRTLNPAFPVTWMAPVEVAAPDGAIALAGFMPNQAVAATFSYPDGRAFHATATIDAEGNGTLDWVSVPGEPLGRYRVTVTQSDRTAEGRYVVKLASQPHLSVRPGTAPAGTTIQIGLAGYPPEATVGLYLYRRQPRGGDQADFIASLPAVQTNAQGEAVSALLTAGDDAQGIYVIMSRTAKGDVRDLTVFTLGGAP